MNSSFNPKVLHVLLQAGTFASWITAASSLPFINIIPHVGPVIGLAAGLAGTYLAWLKTQNIANLPSK